MNMFKGKNYAIYDMDYDMEKRAKVKIGDLG